MLFAPQAFRIVETNKTEKMIASRYKGRKLTKRGGNGKKTSKKEKTAEDRY